MSDLDEGLARSNLERHASGARNACCEWADPCPILSWAQGYVSGARVPYPLREALAHQLETESRSDR